MIYLLLCIFCSGLLVFFFKVFEKFNIQVLPAIVVNYFTCVVCGYFFLPDQTVIFSIENFSSLWFWLSILVGFMFIQIFVLVSKTALEFGVSTASIAMKLGLIFPIILAFTFYGESINVFKVIGVLFAIIAVVLSAYKDENVHATSKKYWLPAVVFIGSGITDSIIQFSQKKFFVHSGFELFTWLLFFMAALSGLVMLMMKLMKHEVSLQWNQVVGGIALGIPNYFSIYFLMMALGNLPWGSSVVFPVNNIGIVCFSTFLSILFFKEKLNKWNWIGLLLAALAIGLIGFSA